LSHHSTAATACGGFAAERRVNRRYQSIAAGAGHPAVTAPQHGAAARRSAANAGSAMLTAKLFDEAELKADLYLYIFVHTSVN